MADDRPIRESTDDARQGVTGHHVRYVLAFSFVGALLAIFLAWAWAAGWAPWNKTPKLPEPASVNPPDT